jgi:hypothetical protein
MPRHEPSKQYLTLPAFGRLFSFLTAFCHTAVSCFPLPAYRFFNTFTHDISKLTPSIKKILKFAKDTTISAMTPQFSTGLVNKITEIKNAYHRKQQHSVSERSKELKPVQLGLVYVPATPVLRFTRKLGKRRCSRLGRIGRFELANSR